MSKGLPNPWKTPSAMSKGAGSSKPNPPTLPATPTPPPSPVQNPIMANKDDLKGEHHSEFSFQSVIMRGDSPAVLFDVDIGDSSLGGILGGIGGLDEKGVDTCFRRQELVGSSVFRPIVACKKQGTSLLIGEEVGQNFEAWVKGLQAKTSLWKINGCPIDQIDKVGKALFYTVTMNHQKHKYIGNIRDGLRIKRDESIVIVPSPEFKWKLGANDIIEGIKKDIQDLKWFIGVICKDNAEPGVIFNGLCPEQSLNTRKLDVLLRLSYLMCHYPLFWGTHERYVFAGIIRKVCSSDKFVFSRLVPLNTGTHDVGRWFDKVNRSTTKNKMLYDIYSTKTNGIDLNFGYDKQFGICSFIGNAFEHYFEKDVTKTLEDLDDLILELFPNVYLKIYGGMMKIGVGERYELYGLLQSGGLNFGN